MKRYIVVFFFFTSVVFGFSPIQNVYKWFEDEYTHFRTYPRLDKAYRYIQQGEEQKAKPLLQKVLEIDPKHTEAASVLVVLCLKQNDNICVEKYIDYLEKKDQARFYLYKTEYTLQKVQYKKSVQYALKALNFDLKTKERYFVKLMLIESYIKLKEYKNASYYINRLYYAKEFPNFKEYYKYLIRLSLEAKRLDLAKKEVEKFFAAGNKATTKQLWRWSHISKNLKDTPYAYKLADLLPDTKKYLHWKVELLTELKQYKQASLKMEKLYKIQETQQNEKKLLYLYKLANQDYKIFEHYSTKLKKQCDEYSLLYLLQHYQDGKVNKYEIMKKYFPYSCLPEDKRFNLQFEYISYLLNTNELQAKIYLEYLLKEKDLSIKYYLKIAQIFYASKVYTNAIKYSFFYLQANPNSQKALRLIGFAYKNEKKYGMAVYYLQKAFQLQKDDLELAKNIGYLYVSVENYKKALKYFLIYLKEQKDPQLSLWVADELFTKKQYEKSLYYLHRYENTNLEKGYEYYLLKAKFAQYNNECEKSSNYFQKALALKDDSHVYYEYVVLLKKCNKIKEALSILNILQKKDPKNIQYIRELASLYYKQKEYEKAIDYGLLAGNSKEWIFTVKNENKYTNKQFDIYFAHTQRLDSYHTTPLPNTSPISDATYKTSGVLSISYKPKLFQNKLAFFGETVYSYDSYDKQWYEINKEKNVSTFGFLEQTAQTSIGVRYKPFEDYALSISVQQMFKTGEFTRNDTFIRTSVGLFDGYEYNIASKKYWYHNLYLDVGYYLQAKELYMYGNYEFGKVYKVSDTYALLPYLLMGGSAVDYAQGTKTKLDAGIGISLLSWYNETKYKSFQITNRIKLEARRAYGGNDKDDKTFRLQFEIMY